MGAGAVSGHRVSPADSQLVSPPSVPASAGQTAVSSGGGNVSHSGVNPAVEESSEPRMPRTCTTVNSMPNKVISCETCDNSFGFFKRKKICKDCHRCFCSTCLPKPPSSLRQNGRQCDKCTILISGKFTRQMLTAWRVKDMRCFLDVRNIPTSTCKEKHDLIDLLLLHFCLESNSVLREQREHDRLVGELADRMRSSSFYSPPTLPHQVPHEDLSSTTDAEEEDRVHTSTTTSGPSLRTSHPQDSQSAENSPGQSRVGGDNRQLMTTEGGESSSSGVLLTEHLRERQMREMRETEHRLQEELDQDEPETRPGIQRATIDDLQTAEETEKMTVRQLKEILANNFVDYRGCCEKHELVERVKRLWNETRANRQRATAAIEDNSIDPGTGLPATTMPTSSTPGGTDPEQDVCKICMDAAIDCILLECGHMITCSKCGKRLADCPICRQYITRVVHVFRS